MATLAEDVDQILLTAEQLEGRVKQLGAQISEDYRGKDLQLVSVLKGALYFTADLIRAITIPVCLDFIAISSYGESSESSGVVRILKDLEEDIGGRHVLVIEDIVDTGLTLGYLLRTLKLRNPASVRLCTLLDKPVRRIQPVHADYVGFEIGDAFVVGYGLDYANKYRNLPYVASIKPEAIH